MQRRVLLEAKLSVHCNFVTFDRCGKEKWVLGGGNISLGVTIGVRGNSVHIIVSLPQSTYIQSTTVYVPSSELGLSHPLTQRGGGGTLFPVPRGGGANSPAGEGLGESQFRRLEKKLWSLQSTYKSATTQIRHSLPIPFVQGPTRCLKNRKWICGPTALLFCSLLQPRI